MYLISHGFFWLGGIPPRLHQSNQELTSKHLNQKIAVHAEFAQQECQRRLRSVVSRPSASPAPDTSLSKTRRQGVPGCGLHDDNYDERLTTTRMTGWDGG